MANFTHSLHVFLIINNYFGKSGKGCSRREMDVQSLELLERTWKERAESLDKKRMVTLTQIEESKGKQLAS